MHDDEPCPNGHSLDPDSECAECQVRWGEMTDAMCSAGANIRVSLPTDVSPWWDRDAYGASWDSVVEGVNGDSLDVQTPTGEIEPVPVEYCRPRPGRYGSR